MPIDRIIWFVIYNFFEVFGRVGGKVGHRVVRFPSGETLALMLRSTQLKRDILPKISPNPSLPKRGNFSLL
jgi:hypothetical protein